MIFSGCFRLPSPVSPIGEPIPEISKLVIAEKERLDRHFDFRSFYTCFVNSSFGSSEIRQVILLRRDGSTRLETFPPQLIPHSLALFISTVLLLQAEKKALFIEEGVTPITKEISVPLHPQKFLSLLLGFIPFDNYEGFQLQTQEQLISRSGLEILRESGRISKFNLRDNDEVIIVSGTLNDFDSVPRRLTIEIHEAGTYIECRNQLIETHETLSDKPFSVSIPNGWQK